MSNEINDWLWDKLAEILIEANVIDKAIQTIVWLGDFAGVVHGIKNGIHVTYRVWFDDDEEKWLYELND